MSEQAVQIENRDFAAPRCEPIAVLDGTRGRSVESSRGRQGRGRGAGWPDEFRPVALRLRYAIAGFVFALLLSFAVFLAFSQTQSITCEPQLTLERFA